MSHRYPPGHPYRILRPAILQRDNNTCRYCGDTEDLTVDHIIPVSRRGNHHTDNMVTACEPCNVTKDRRTLAEWVATGTAPEGAQALLARRQSEGLPC